MTAHVGMRHRQPTAASIAWLLTIALAASVIGTAPARADGTQPEWMISAAGGSIERDGDSTRPDEALSVTRRLGTGYVRASIVHFTTEVSQADATLPSSYTLGYLAGGVVKGHWFADVYGTFGLQDYHAIQTAMGVHAVNGADRSDVFGFGGDGGYGRRFGRNWGLTSALSVQYIRSTALPAVADPPTVDGDIRETGITVGETVSFDRFFGHDRTSSVGLHVTQYETTNSAAALVSADRGATSSPNDRRADAWTELGGHALVRLSRRWYLDAAASRTLGAAAGNVTMTTMGVRYLF